MRMPFGKYRDCQIADIPTDYLEWVLENVVDLRAGLRFVIECELKERGTYQSRRSDHPRRYSNSAALPAAQIRDVIRSWYRSCSLRWHPDRGGSTEGMQAINDAHERLCRAFQLEGAA